MPVQTCPWLRHCLTCTDLVINFHTKNILVYYNAIKYFTGIFVGIKFLLKSASVEQIPQHLLESVSTCYSHRIQACKWCFLTHLPSTHKQLQSMTVDTASSICRKCLCYNGTITVIPAASDLCETSYYGNFVAV